MPQDGAHPSQANVPPPGLVLTFVGPIQPPASKNLRNALCMAVSQKTPKVKILFSSSGGFVDEGFALYGFLRSLPLELTIHAIGAVESMANIVFLAASKRLATPESHFMLHAFTWNFLAQAYEKPQVDNIEKILENSRLKYLRIFESRTSLTEQDLDKLNAFEKVAILNPTFAKEKGIIQEIADATTPAGWVAYNVDF